MMFLLYYHVIIAVALAILMTPIRQEGMVSTLDNNPVYEFKD